MSWQLRSSQKSHGWHSQNFPGCQFDWLAFAGDDILYYNFLHRQLLVLTFLSSRSISAPRFQSIQIRIIYFLSTGDTNRRKTFPINFFHVFIVCQFARTHNVSLRAYVRAKNATRTTAATKKKYFISRRYDLFICSADSHYEWAPHTILQQCLWYLKINAQIGSKYAECSRVHIDDV